MNRINSLFAVVVVLAVASVCHAQEKPALYVVSVGISKYHDKRFEHGVAYAAKDAQDFTSHFVAQRGKMFETVESKLLCDEQATRGRANVGSVVKLVNLETKREQTFKLVSATEVDPAQGKISIQSPVGCRDEPCHGR